MIKWALALAGACCIAWAAGNVSVAAIGAPTISEVVRAHGDQISAAPQVLVGDIFGTYLARWIVAAWALAALASLGLCVVAARLATSRQGMYAAFFLAAMLAMVACHWAGMKVVAEARELAPEGVKPREAEASARFDRLHSLSTRLFQAQTLFLAGLGVCLLVGAVRTAGTSATARFA
jgi:hypothetical protein